MDFGQLVTLHKLIGCEPNIVARVTNTMTMFVMVSANLGVALVPAPLVSVGLPHLKFLKVTRCNDSRQMSLAQQSFYLNADHHAFDFRQVGSTPSAGYLWQITVAILQEGEIEAAGAEGLICCVCCHSESSHRP